MLDEEPDMAPPRGMPDGLEFGVPPGLDENDVLDLAEAEPSLDGLSDGLDPDDRRAFDVGDGPGGCDDAPPAVPDPGGDIIAAYVDQLGEDFKLFGPSDDEGGLPGDGDLGGGDGGIPDGPPPVPPPPEAPPPPWAGLAAPSPLGYVSDAGGRWVCRVQRREHEGRVWINCYRHAGCRANVKAPGPSNEEVFRWLFDVEASTREMTRAQKQELVARHKTLAKERWG